MSFFRLFCYGVVLFLAGCTSVPETQKLVLRKNQVQVKEGETLYTIAARHKVTPRQLMQANNLQSTAIAAGEILTIPSQEMLQAQAKAAVRYVPLEGLDVKKDITSEISQAELADVSTSAAVAAPVIEKRTSEFVWPVKGPVLQSFGKAPGALSLGITIGAPLGADVYAVKDGVVAYVGDDLQDYGLLILVKHACGTVSVYGNLAENPRVKKDDDVSQGQVIAKTGQSGFKQETPRLYFELRRPKNQDDKKPKAVNPVPYLAD